MIKLQRHSVVKELSQHYTKDLNPYLISIKKMPESWNHVAWKMWSHRPKLGELEWGEREREKRLNFLSKTKRWGYSVFLFRIRRLPSKFTRSEDNEKNLNKDGTALEPSAYE
jgi:hypothetical protein